MDDEPTIEVPPELKEPLHPIEDESDLHRRIREEVERQLAEEDDVVADDEDRRLHWMYFIAGVIAMVLAAVVILGIAAYHAREAKEGQITKRERIAACQNIETEAGRLLCIDGMR